ncbi:unnamed protein product [Ectocarpus sp. 13 AM-2016]
MYKPRLRCRPVSACARVAPLWCNETTAQLWSLRMTQQKKKKKSHTAWTRLDRLNKKKQKRAKNTNTKRKYKTKPSQNTDHHTPFLLSPTAFVLQDTITTTTYCCCIFSGWWWGGGMHLVAPSSIYMGSIHESNVRHDLTLPLGGFHGMVESKRERRQERESFCTPPPPVPRPRPHDLVHGPPFGASGTNRQYSHTFCRMGTTCPPHLFAKPYSCQFVTVEPDRMLPPPLREFRSSRRLLQRVQLMISPLMHMHCTIHHLPSPLHHYPSWPVDEQQHRTATIITAMLYNGQPCRRVDGPPALWPWLRPPRDWRWQCGVWLDPDITKQ